MYNVCQLCATVCLWDTETGGKVILLEESKLQWGETEAEITSLLIACAIVQRLLNIFFHQRWQNRAYENWKKKKKSKKPSWRKHAGWPSEGKRKHTQPWRGEGVTEITSDTAWEAYGQDICFWRGHGRYKLEETGPTCGNQAPGSACEWVL